MEATKLKLGRRVFKFYKLKCSVCGQPFPCSGSRRVTCGQPDCQRRHAIRRSIKNLKKLFILRRLKCPYCSDFFTFKARPDKKNQRVTCGQAKCRTEHGRVKANQRQKRIISDPVLNEIKKRQMREFFAVRSAMYRELKSLAGIKPMSGRPTTAKVMLRELERVAGL